MLYPWMQLAELTTTDTNGGVGAAMAVAGNTVAVSGDFEATGAVYVYVKPASGWANGTQVAKLTSSTGLSLGYSVAISSDANTIVAGDPSTGADNNGAVYVFVKPAGGWKDMTETAKLTISSAPKAIALCTSVAISGDSIVAGAAGFGSGVEERPTCSSNRRAVGKTGRKTPSSRRRIEPATTISAIRFRSVEAP